MRERVGWGLMLGACGGFLILCLLGVSPELAGLIGVVCFGVGYRLT